MVGSDRKVGPTRATPRVERRNRLSRSGLRVTAALWACAAAFQIAATPALAQTAGVCECNPRSESDNDRWWLALLPAGALGLLGLVPSSTAPAPVLTVPPAVVRPEYVPPPPLALPPTTVTPPPVVPPVAPGSDTRIPVRKVVPPPPPTTSSYNGPVPRFKLLRQLLGVPESAVAAARAREARPAVAPATATARTVSAPRAATPVRTAAPAKPSPAKPAPAKRAPASPRA